MHFYRLSIPLVLFASFNAGAQKATEVAPSTSNVPAPVISPPTPPTPPVVVAAPQPVIVPAAAPPSPPPNAAPTTIIISQAPATSAPAQTVQPTPSSEAPTEAKLASEIFRWQATLAAASGNESSAYLAPSAQNSQGTGIYAGLSYSALSYMNFEAFYSYNPQTFSTHHDFGADLALTPFSVNVFGFLDVLSLNVKAGLTNIDTGHGAVSTFLGVGAAFTFGKGRWAAVADLRGNQNFRLADLGIAYRF